MFTRLRGIGEQMFWWESPDGSRVFAYKPLKSGGESLPEQEEIDSYLINLNQQYGVKNGLTLIGVGNHGGGAISADVERMKKTMAQRKLDRVKSNHPASLIFSKPYQFVTSLNEQTNGLPVIKNELIPTIRGAYTSVGEIKKGNRYAENLLMTWEKFSAIDSFLGNFEYPRDNILTAWKKVMLNQFHDTISGTDIHSSIDDALQRYQDVMEIGQKDLFRSLKSICKRINTSRSGKPVIVFNPLGWQRSDVVEIEINVQKSDEVFEIIDDSGQNIPYQIISENNIHDGKTIRLFFIAENIPSLGYKSFWLKPVQDRPQFKSVFKATKARIENEFFKITIDPSNGCLTSIFDKQYQYEILDKTAYANLIQIFEDYGDSEGFLKSSDGVSEYNLWDGSFWETESNPKINLVENGPLRQMVRIKKKFGFARFNQTIKLYQNIRRIDFDLVIDWEGKNKMVKIAFPLNVKSPMATYEIPYGSIKRKSRGEEQVAQKWVDISEQNYGVSLLNDSRYGHDITENTIRLSALRSPDRPSSGTCKSMTIWDLSLLGNV